ncbi:hypothetical protein [Nonomuraea sp. NPDC050643]|uniref:hypothetical protein n=1 Tax=Nonomuraea sp. NPDC050643 TaxID=3155660 RepID=UPI00340942BA
MDPSMALLVAAMVVGVLVLAGSRNPKVKCWRCGGGKVLRSWLLPWRYRSCPRCGGDGELRGFFGRR